MGKDHLPAGKGQRVVDIHRAAPEVVVHQLHGKHGGCQQDHQREQYGRKVAVDLAIGAGTQGKSMLRAVDQLQRQLQRQGDEFQQEEQGAHQPGAAQVVPEHGCQAGMVRR